MSIEWTMVQVHRVQRPLKYGPLFLVQTLMLDVGDRVRLPWPIFFQQTFEFMDELELNHVMDECDEADQRRATFRVIA